MDIYLNWHHTATRVGATFYFFKKYVSGVVNPGAWATEEDIKKSYNKLINALTKIEEIWLKPKRSTMFMFGDLPSICDLSLFCEMT